MKGFEVSFRGETVRISVNELSVFSVVVNKVRGKMDMHVGGLLMDVEKYPAWMAAEDLKQGDEIIITRKEVEESSPTLVPPPDFDPNSLLTPEKLKEIWQYQLKYFYSIERVLQQEGLIEQGV